MKVLRLQSLSTLTRDEKKSALRYLMFVKKKRDGQTRGRGCDNRRKQHAYTNKNYFSSPTIATETAFLTLVIAAKEKRDVMTVNVTGTILQMSPGKSAFMSGFTREWRSY